MISNLKLLLDAIEYEGKYPNLVHLARQDFEELKDLIHELALFVPDNIRKKVPPDLLENW